MNLTLIPLDSLLPHPGNANIMPAPLFRTLCAHMRRTRRYPPLIVRPHPDTSQRGKYEILDGHHRALALREIGETSVRCDVWAVDDREATLLLLTLNRLEGADDPRRRGRLFDDLRSLDSDLLNFDALAAMVPDDRERIERLLALTIPAEMIAPSTARETDAPEAVTFFLAPIHRSRLFERLAPIDPNRSAALIRLLNLETEDRRPSA